MRTSTLTLERDIADASTTTNSPGKAAEIPDVPSRLRDHRGRASLSTRLPSLGYQSRVSVGAPPFQRVYTATLSKTVSRLPINPHEAGGAAYGVSSGVSYPNDVYVTSATLAESESPTPRTALGPSSNYLSTTLSQPPISLLSAAPNAGYEGVLRPALQIEGYESSSNDSSYFAGNEPGGEIRATQM